VAVNEAVHDNYLVAGGYDFHKSVAANLACAACNKNFHLLFIILLFDLQLVLCGSSTVIFFGLLRNCP
jgi:hypothetical protein